MAANPLVLALQLSVPAFKDGPLESKPFGLSASWVNSSTGELSFEAADTKALSFGLMSPTGAQFKALLLYQQLIEGAEDVTVVLNSASAGAVKLSPGGIWVLANQLAQDTPTVEITTTTVAVVQYYVYGLSEEECREN